jgi:hypothetical protein
MKNTCLSQFTKEKQKKKTILHLLVITQSLPVVPQQNLGRTHAEFFLLDGKDNGVNRTKDESE